MCNWCPVIITDYDFKEYLQFSKSCETQKGSRHDGADQVIPEIPEKQTNTETFEQIDLHMYCYI